MPALVTTGASIIVAPLFVLCFAVLGLALGRRALRLLGISEHAVVAEMGVVSLAMGAWTLAMVPFLLGVAGVLGLHSLLAAHAALALAVRRDVAAVVRRAISVVRTFSFPRGWLGVWLVTLAPLFVTSALLALTPTLDPDGLGYHLTVPKRWLASGSLGYLPTYPYSNTPMGIEMLFLTALAVGGDAAAKLVHFALGTAAAVGLVLAGRRLGGSRRDAGPNHGVLIGAAAATLFLVGPAGIGQLLGWAYLEGATSFAMIASALAWLVWFERRAVRWLWTAAFLAGVGVSFKITAALFPVALAVLTTLLLRHEVKTAGGRLLPALAPLVKAVPFLAAPVLPWFARSAVITGNPFFPLFAQWIPSRDLSAEIASKFDQYNRYTVWGVSIGADWSLEKRKLILLVALLVVVTAGALVFFLSRSPLVRMTTAVVTGTIVVQLSAAGLYVRYWVPLLSVVELPVLAGVALLLRERRFQYGALVGLTALGALFQAARNLKGVDYDVAGLVKTAAGLEKQRDFLLRHVQLYPIYEHANRELPKAAGVLLAYYCGGFYLDRSTFCGDIVQESLRYSSFDGFVEDARRLNITHLVAPREWGDLGSKAPLEGGNVSMLIRENEHAYVGRLIREHGQLLIAASDQGLYELDWKSLNSAAP